MVLFTVKYSHKLFTGSYFNVIIFDKEGVHMGYNFNKKRVNKTYKGLYIDKNLADKIDNIAFKTDASWNAVAIDMLETCVKSYEETKEKKEDKNIYNNI